MPPHVVNRSAQEGGCKEPALAGSLVAHDGAEHACERQPILDQLSYFDDFHLGMTPHIGQQSMTSFTCESLPTEVKVPKILDSSLVA